MPVASQEDIESIVTKIRKAASHADSEATLQTDVEHILRSFFEKIGVEYEPQHNATVIRGRPDTLYGHVLIEYKIPGALGSPRKIDAALEEVQKNIIETSTKNKEESSKYVGIVLDGYSITFTKMRRGNWISDPILEVRKESIERLLEYLRGLARKPLHPDLMVKEFGPESATAKHVVFLLYQSIAYSKHPRAIALFEQWKKTFSQVCGYDFKSPKEEFKVLVGKYKLGTKKPDILKLLFSIHSYFALVIKLLAAEISVTYTSFFARSFLEDLLLATSQNMKEKIVELEDGGFFADQGINNFLEGDYFSWYLDVWDDKIRDLVKNVATKLSVYEPATTTLEPDQVKDLLKKLYQYLVPKKIRHDLGEFFTPDWLAEVLLDEVDYQGDPNKRVLDPSCGSGTFLVLAIRRIREFAEDKMLGKDETLALTLKNVTGFDLNPLAVIASRTNYLIALGDLLRQRPKQGIHIPVYLCDSISVSGIETPEGKVYHVSTAVGKFKVPESVVEEASLDEISSIADHSISEDYKPAEFVGRITNRFPGLKKGVLNDLRVLYEQLLALEKKGVNRIWARVIKNAFAPLFSGQFDYVVGNPPWVNWDSLPEEYRNESRSIWEQYGLLEQTRGLALGKAKRDISMLFVARALDRFLKEKGQIAYLITFTVFKNEAGAGFRRFLSEKCKVYKIHNLVQPRPFEGAVNRTALLRVTQGETAFPVPGVTWIKTTPGFADPSETLQHILNETVRTETIVRPVDGKPVSPWMMNFPIVDAISPKFLGTSPYRAFEGVNAALNGVYWVKILEEKPAGVLIENLAEEGRTEVKRHSLSVDPKFLYPLVRGRDVQRWLATPSNHWILPINGKGQVLSESEFKENYPETYTYFHKFAGVLKNRKGEPYKSRLADNSQPFYWLFNVQQALSPFKVVWKEIAGAITGTGVFTSAVLKPQKHKTLGTRIVVPDHKLMFVPTQTLDEAYYLSAILNSTPIRLIVGSYTIETHLATEVTKKIRIIPYTGDSMQSKLAKMAGEAEAATKNEDKNRVLQLEHDIDDLVGQMYGVKPDQIELLRKLTLLEDKPSPDEC